MGCRISALNHDIHLETSYAYDIEITKKVAALKNELKQTQVQLIDVPLEETSNMTEEQLNAYFNNPKVNKKYRLKKR